MWRAARSGVVPLTERVTVDCRNLKAGDSPIFFERQISRNLNRFSPRQLTVCLNGLVRSAAYSRPVVLSISSRLNETLAKLTLKDLATVVNAFARIGLKNEIFLSDAYTRVLRKSKDAELAPLVLLLDGYAKLDLLPSFELLEIIKKKIQHSDAVVKPIDAVTLLRAVARVDQADRIRSIIPNILASISASAGEDIDMKISGLVNLAKLNLLATEEELIEKIIVDVHACSRERSFFRSIQFFFALAHLGASREIQLDLVNEIVSRINGESGVWESCRDPESACVLLVSALTRSVESLPFGQIDFLASSVRRFLTKPESFAVFVNLKSSVNAALTAADRADIARLFTQSTKLLEPQSFSLFLNALTKLEEFELVFELLSSQDYNSRSFLIGLTDQAVHTSVLALTFLADILLGLEISLPNLRSLCIEWIEKLLELRSSNQHWPKESVTQMRIVRAICLSNSELGIFSKSVPSCNLEFENPNHVSNFHREVLHALPDQITLPNITDRRTGYEIDILLDDTRVS